MGEFLNDKSQSHIQTYPESYLTSSSVLLWEVTKEEPDRTPKTSLKVASIFMCLSLLSVLYLICKLSENRDLIYLIHHHISEVSSSWPIVGA